MKENKIFYATVIGVIGLFIGWHVYSFDSLITPADAVASSKTTAQQEEVWVMNSPDRDQSKLKLITNTADESRFEGERTGAARDDNGIIMVTYDITTTVTKTSMNPNYYSG